MIIATLIIIGLLLVAIHRHSEKQQEIITQKIIKNYIDKLEKENRNVIF